jgi:DNA-binding response OmpR family regulator
MRSVRVLIADPDESLQASYREALAREGFEVATATDGLDCMAKLRSFAPDVLVLEPAQLWGGGDGVLARMGEEADVPPAKVLVLSDRRDLDRLGREASLAIGEYQIKPVLPDRLVERIRRLLEPSPLRGEGDRSPDDAGRPARVAAPRERADQGP